MYDAGHTVSFTGPSGTRAEAWGVTPALVKHQSPGVTHHCTHTYSRTHTQQDCRFEPLDGNAVLGGGHFPLKDINCHATPVVHNHVGAVCHVLAAARQVCKSVLGTEHADQKGCTAI